MANMIRIVVEIDSAGWTQATASLSAKDMGVVYGLDHLKCRGQEINQIRARQDWQFERFGHDNGYGDRFQTTPTELSDTGVEINFQVDR